MKTYRIYIALALCACIPVASASADEVRARRTDKTTTTLSELERPHIYRPMDSDRIERFDIIQHSPGRSEPDDKLASVYSSRDREIVRDARPLTPEEIRARDIELRNQQLEKRNR